MAKQTSRIVVVDSTMAGQAKPLRHSVYAIVYVPSWLRIRSILEWQDAMHVIKSLDVMKEYFVASPFEERPIRAQRCAYSLRALQIFGHRRDGTQRFSDISRDLLYRRVKSLNEYLAANPVVAWDWVVSWTESRAMAEAFPVEFVQLYRRLRSVYDSKRNPKPELLYFVDLLATVAKEKGIDTERTWK